MAEFFNDQYRESYLEALGREQEGYEARRKAATEAGDQNVAKVMASRKKQVQAEMDRVRGFVSKETTADESEQGDADDAGAEDKAKGAGAAKS